MIQHFLSLPIFLFLIPDIKRGLTSLSAAPAYTPYLILATNLVTQLICVSSVNQLTSVSFIFLLCLPNPPVSPTTPESFFGVDQSGSYNAQSAQSLPQRVVFWEGLELASMCRCWDGIRGELFVFANA